MNQDISVQQPALLGSLDAVLEAHGLLKLLAALPVVLWQRAMRWSDVELDHLDEHLRKDMGLPPPKHAPLPPPFEIWRLWR